MTYSLQDSDIYDLCYHIRISTGLLSNEGVSEASEAVRNFLIRKEKGALLVASKEDGCAASN